jgi:hypothetical protein
LKLETLVMIQTKFGSNWSSSWKYDYPSWSYCLFFIKFSSKCLYFSSYISITIRDRD